MIVEAIPGDLAFKIPGAGDEGGDILVRPIKAVDRHLLQLGFDQLSERSRYFRFLMRREALSEEELDFLTAKNTEDHVALGALDLYFSPPRPVGIARWVRNEDVPDSAEIAITITDRYQGRGLGTILICALGFRAASAGLDHFTAIVHQENAAMLHIFQQLGGHLEPASKGEVQVVLPILKDAANYPQNSLGDKMREVFSLLRD